MKKRKTWMRAIGLAYGITLFIAAVGVQGATAAETHAFNPTLSLTGGCGVSPLDPIPDPAEPPCPSPEPPCPTEPVGSHPPSGCFSSPAGIATDAFGNIYVASPGPEAAQGDQGRIDIFNSEGFFITEVADDDGPGAMAVDSEGNLYVSNRFPDQSEVVVRYEPTPPYKPAEGQIEYGTPPEVLVPKTEAGVSGLDVDRANDQVYVPLFENGSLHVNVYKSAAEGNAKIEEFGAGLIDSFGITVDAAHGRVYDEHTEASERVINVFDLAAPHAVLFKINSSALPAGDFLSPLSLAADEGTGHLFVYDGGAKKVYEFDENGVYVQTIEHGFQNVFQSQIAIDNGIQSPNGALNPRGRFLYVPSNPGGIGHSYAFGPSSTDEPEVNSVSVTNVGENEVELQASIEPFGLPTHYVFQYTTQAAFEAGGFSDAQNAGEGNIPAGNAPVEISAAATGLFSETTYRFRVVATNEEGSDEGEGVFATYPAAVASPPCPNDPFRVGLSAFLPDCRAYELVTPPATNARSPRGLGQGGNYAAQLASPEGNAVSFLIEGGSLPGADAVGSLIGDPYLSTRGASGWGTSYTGPSGSEVKGLRVGNPSPDQGHYFWSGPPAAGGTETNYVQYPGGSASPIGRGSLTTDVQAAGALISSNAAHIVFMSAVKLEPAAPLDGTRAVYDRTSDEVTHVVSLLPGNLTPGSGENAVYVGASLDGRGIAFSIGHRLYLRYENQETYELGENILFAGVAEGGNRVFYLKGGDLYRFDAQTGITTPFTTVGNVVPVNVSADGSTAYFISPSILTLEPNPRGVVPIAGKENLYRSREGTIAFVGTVTKRDVVGEPANEAFGGLGMWAAVTGTWTSAVEGRRGADPSRSTPDGNAMVFESRADLTGYDPEGLAQVYRYDSSANSLICLSCNPTRAPASGDASLQSVSQQLGGNEPFSAYTYVENITLGGQRVLFQSPDALVPGDSDNLQDVYEWEAGGTGTCTRSAGCLYLISSGHSANPDYLYAVSNGGNDVFFRTGDLLLPSDQEETPSIYDARVEGGFPEPVENVCQAEGCRDGLTSPPSFPTPASGAAGPSGNVSKKGCPKGKRKVRRHGKAVCVKKHRKHHHKARHHKSSSKSKGAGK